MVETRAPENGANFATCRIFVVSNAYKKRKMAFFEGCPVGWGGGVPIGAGLVDGEVDQAPWLQERVGGAVGAMAVPKKGEEGRGQGRVGLAIEGGCKGFGSGQVGGRGHGPQGEQIQQCSQFRVMP